MFCIINNPTVFIPESNFAYHIFGGNKELPRVFEQKKIAKSTFVLWHSRRWAEVGEKKGLVRRQKVVIWESELKREEWNWTQGSDVGHMSKGNHLWVSGPQGERRVQAQAELSSHFDWKVKYTINQDKDARLRSWFGDRKIRSHISRRSLQFVRCPYWVNFLIIRKKLKSGILYDTNA